MVVREAWSGLVKLKCGHGGKKEGSHSSDNKSKPTSAATVNHL